MAVIPPLKLEKLYKDMESEGYHRGSPIWEHILDQYEDIQEHINAFIALSNSDQDGRPPLRRIKRKYLAIIDECEAGFGGDIPIQSYSHTDGNGKEFFDDFDFLLEYIEEYKEERDADWKEERLDKLIQFCLNVELKIEPFHINTVAESGYPSDDGENCWDCGIENENADMNICSSCGHTICWDCQGAINASDHSPHRDGRKEDGLECGNTRRVL